jgi:GTP-binding protein HflX
VGNVVVSDTVGFVRELPHQLVAAFRATLEETIHADLLLHVVDGSSPVRMEQIEQVNEVLREIGADHVPQILVWNKIDAAGLEPGVERDEYDKISRVFISAQSGAGLDLLRDAIVEAAKSAPGLTPLNNEEQDDAEPDDAQDAEPAERIPTSTPVGPH